MSGLEDAVDVLADANNFSGVVRVDRGGRVELTKAYGTADRRHGISNAVDTQFGIASGTKALTALTIVSLVADGSLAFSTRARSVLGEDLPLIGGDVTLEQLLAHRSGIGDYLDEDAGLDLDDMQYPVPVYELASTEQYLAVLDGYPPKFEPGERFAYCNGGYVVLALIAERTSGVPFHELVRQRVSAPAGMHDTEFFRSDDLPGRARGRIRAARRHVTHQRVPPPGPGQRRRRHLLDDSGHRARSGTRSSPGGSSRPISQRRWSGPGAIRRTMRATGSASGFIRRRTS